MDVNKEFIGKKIKEYRKKKHISQAELAEITGLSDKHIGRIEAGKYFPNFLNFLNIMEALELNFSDLGLNFEKTSKNAELEELLGLIYNSDTEKIKLYLKIVRAIKE